MIGLVLLASCSSQNKSKRLSKVKDQESYDFILSNFDRLNLPTHEDTISKMIGIVQPELDQKMRMNYARMIKATSLKYNIKPQIMIALIDTESNFKAEKVSTTGDLSVAQVNHEVWNKEFRRLNEPLIDVKKLVHHDQSYAIMTMGKILSFLKKRHEKKDRRWYARYHSNTKKYKRAYLKKIEIRMRMLDKEKEYILANKKNANKVTLN